MITKFQKFAETLAATRRSHAKAANNTVSTSSPASVPAEASAPNEPRGRKVCLSLISFNRVD